MFARALREFILWPKPCTDQTWMTRNDCLRGTEGVECGVDGALVCWGAGAGACAGACAGAYVVVGRNAACSANSRGTGGECLWGRCRERHVWRKEGPWEGQRQRDVFRTMAELMEVRMSRSDVLSRTSVVFGRLNFWRSESHTTVRSAH